MTGRARASAATIVDSIMGVEEADALSGTSIAMKSSPTMNLVLNFKTSCKRFTFESISDFAVEDGLCCSVLVLLILNVEVQVRSELQ